MGILETLQENIKKIGIKEIARRSGISTSNISRISSGQIQPSLKIAEKISNAIGMKIQLEEDPELLKLKFEGPRLKMVLRTLRRLRPHLTKYDIRHIVVFGSVARGEDKKDSDIDLYLDWGGHKPKTSILLKAEGEILENFPGMKVDMISDTDTPKTQRLKLEIEKDGKNAF